MSEPTDPTVMLLRSFCLSTMAGQYEEVMRRAEKESWLKTRGPHFSELGAETYDDAAPGEGGNLLEEGGA